MVILFFVFSTKNSSQQIFNKNTKVARVTALLARADSLKNYHIKQSLSLAKEAEEIGLTAGIDSLFPKIYMIQGKLLVYNSEYPEALEKLLAAETYYEQVPDAFKRKSTYKREYAICLQKISEVHFQLNRLDKALEYIEASIKLYKALGDHDQTAKATSNLAGIYFKKGMTQEALNTYLEVLGYYKDAEENTDLHTLYTNIGAANLSLKNMDVSIEFLNKAEKELQIEYSKDQDNYTIKKDLSQLYYVKSVYYYMDENQDLFGNYLQKSLSILGDNYAPTEANAPLFTLHKFYSKKKDYKNAYTYLLKYQDVKDSLFNLKNNSRIHQLEKEHELYKKERDYELDKRNTERKYWIILASLLVVVLLILLFLNHQKRIIIKTAEEKKRLIHIKRNLENEISVKDEVLVQKEKEVKALASKIVLKNQNINSLQSHVEKIDRSIRNDISHKKINDMIKSSRDVEDIERDREQLLRNLEQISVAMFTELEAEFPGITTRQKHLAALIKQGFSAKEIAILFNISHKAAQTAKYRLKKVLKLESEQDLDTYLRQY